MDAAITAVAAEDEATRGKVREEGSAAAVGGGKSKDEGESEAEASMSNVQGGHAAAAIVAGPLQSKLCYANRGPRDLDLLGMPREKAHRAPQEVNFSPNAFSARGLRQVLNMCAQSSCLQVLKL